MQDNKIQRLCGQNIQTRDIRSLKPAQRNARTHSPKQIEQIARSIETFGWVNPIIVDETSTIIAGHGRYEAAKQLGLKAVPSIRISDMSDAKKRAYALADNKLAEKAGWNNELLSLELGELIELDIDVGLTGFEPPEIDILVYSDAVRETEPEVPEPAPVAVSKLGDLWRVGPHRIYCGDALDPASYETLLQGERVDCTFTDPPYNVPIEGHVTGNGKIKHREFAMASGEMSEEAFQHFLDQTCETIAEQSSEGAIAFVCMDWRHIAELVRAGDRAFSALKNIVVWDKGVGGMGSLYRSQHELICVFKSRAGGHTNNVELGRHGRNRTNVWSYPGVQSRRGDLKYHPTVKPVAMVADALLDVTARGGLVLDPFLGSGTTLLAAERVGRVARGIELDPLYVDVAIRRYQELHRIDAVHAESELTFGRLEERAREVADDPEK